MSSIGGIPTLTKSIRTRFADDLLWLPFVTAKYVEVTGILLSGKKKLAF